MNPIYHYISYRIFLSDYYFDKKKNSKGFSYRSFATAVGVKLVNFLPWLIDGTRNLAEKTVPNVISALELNREEGEYFFLLVRFDQSKTHKLRESLFNEIITIRANKNVEQTAEERHLYFSRWETVAIRELLNIIKFNPKVRDGYQKLGAMLRPRINKTQARAAVQTLIKLNLIEPNSDNILKPVTQQVNTGNESPTFFIKGFHNQMLERAKSSMDIFPPEKRDISGITMSVTANGQQKIKEAIQKFRAEVEEIVRSDGAADRLIQLNTQMFPLGEVSND